VRMRGLVTQMVAERVKEYFADPSVGTGPGPVIRPPADPGALAELERRSGQSLEAGYREFLSLTDGMEGLPFTLLGCRDWEPGGMSQAAEEFRETVLDSEPEDVGVSPGMSLSPVAVNRDRSRGVFLIDTGGTAEERFWWTGEGDSFFFMGFADVLGFLIDAGSCDPKESLRS
jgi:hypothetical protein